MRLMIWAASLPRPLRMTRRGSLRALLAFLTMPMAPSAAAKDSWPARKAKHLVSSLQQHSAQVAVAQTHLAVLGHRAVDAEGLQAHADSFGSLGSGLDARLQGDGRAHACRPSTAFSKQMGWMLLTIS